jgi:hypothetical protein
MFTPEGEAEQVGRTVADAVRNKAKVTVTIGDASYTFNQGDPEPVQAMHDATYDKYNIDMLRRSLDLAGIYDYKKSFKFTNAELKELLRGALE